MTYFYRLAILTLLCNAPVIGTAKADIIQSVGVGGGSFAGASEFGQTFTATAAESVVGTISFRWLSTNNALADPTITARLRSGAGFSGSILGTQTLTAIPDSTVDGSWVDFQFPALANLTPGQTYSLHFTRDNGGTTSGGYYHAGTDALAGGTFLAGGGSVISGTDLTFRVLAIPEPTSIALLGGVAALATTRRRTRRDIR